MNTPFRPGRSQLPVHLRKSLWRLLLIVASATGCQSLPALLEGEPPDVATDEEAESHRQAFVESGSHTSVHWLLTNRVRQGMTRGEVAVCLGSRGAREFDDQRLKGDGSGYQVGDETYKWGPDSHGDSYYLMFRDGKLVNFDPGEFD